MYAFSVQHNSAKAGSQIYDFLHYSKACDLSMLIDFAMLLRLTNEHLKAAL